MSAPSSAPSPVASPAPAEARARVAATRLGREYAAHARYVARWLIVVAPVGVLVGSAVALFLWALDQVTRLRWTHPWLLWLLPLGGVAVGALYEWWGRSAEAGNDLIMDEIHEPGGGVPGRMAPLVLVGTLVTHLFGGSAGREGTAVQMGGSIASTLERLLLTRLPASFQLDDDDRRVLLQAGVAAGFGAVFGTPITGAVFALEVLAIGRLSYAALVPCLMAALLGDWTTAAWGVHHTPYPTLALGALGVRHLDLALLGKVALAAAAFGLVSTLFAATTHGLGRVFRRLVPRRWLRPAAGAAVVIGLTLLLGTRDYLGLGVASPDAPGVSIRSSFQPGGAQPWSWALKLLFTAATLSSGFKGGEVTPLFFVGAALGNTLAGVLHAPVALFAALGFVSVFAGATNTPLACTIMGVELFGAEPAIYVATACFLAYLFSGHSGIYLAQRLGTPKGDLDAPPAAGMREVTLRHLHPPPVPATAPTHTAPPLTVPTRTDPSAPSPTPATHAPAWHPLPPTPMHLPRFPHQLHPEPTWPARPVGVARVYLSPHRRRPKAGWWARLVGRPLSTDIVLAAKRFGLPHALVVPASHGYTARGPAVGDHPEHGTRRLAQCVELIGDPAQVEAFCHEHVALLAGHPLVVHRAEQRELAWDAPHWVDALVRAHGRLA